MHYSVMLSLIRPRSNKSLFRKCILESSLSEAMDYYADCTMK